MASIVTDDGKGTGIGVIIPLGTGKFSPPVQKNNLTSQINTLQSNTAGKTSADFYNAMMSSQRTPTELTQTIGQNTGLLSRIEGTRAQAMDIQKQMLGDQSYIFNATNPDGTPIDPRVKVAQYEANMKTYVSRLDQLSQLENAYKSELSVLTKAEQERISADNDRNKLAISYLKDIEDRKAEQERLAEQKRQFNVSKDIQQKQFDETLEQNKYEFESTLNKPELQTDAEGNFVYVSPKEGMRTDRHNNPTAFTTDIAKQAGLKEGVDYEVGDPFSGGKYKTAKILGDPIETTIKVIDKIGFKTQSGATRWTYTDKLGVNNEKWKKMSYDQKAEVIKQMYKQEGGSGQIFADVKQTGVKSEKKEKIDLATYVKNLKIPNESFKQEDVDKLVGIINAEFPTTDSKNILEAIKNVAPENAKNSIKELGAVKMVASGLEDLTKKDTKSLLGSLNSSFGKEKSLEILIKSGFFDTYKPGFWGDDDQYDAVQEWYGKGLEEKIKSLSSKILEGNIKL